MNVQTSYLGTFCAGSVTESVTRMMKSLMTNSLALQMNWSGSRGKHSFSVLKFSATICGMKILTV